MAQTLKVLAQVYPVAGVLTDGYTVGGGLQIAVSSILVCNQGRTRASFRIAVAVAGAADERKQYLYYDHEVFGRDTYAAVLGLTLGATDVVRVFSSNGDMSFNFMGAEKT